MMVNRHHYHQIKARYPEHILILGSYDGTYLAVGNDAETISQYAGINLQPNKWGDLDTVYIESQDVDGIVSGMTSNGHRIALGVMTREGKERTP